MRSIPPSVESRAPFWETLRPLMQDLVALQKSLASRHRLSSSQYFVLRYLSVHGPTRVSQLAQWSGVSRAAATEQVNGLARHRWVRREPDPEDGRSVRIRLTSQGRREIDQIDSEARTTLERAVGHLSRAERGELTHVLARLHAVIRAEVPLPAGWPWKEGS